MTASSTRDAVHARVAEVFAWIFEVWATGRYPTHGFYKEKFEADTVRGKLAGKEMADGSPKFHWGELLRLRGSSY